MHSTGLISQEKRRQKKTSREQGMKLNPASSNDMYWDWLLNRSWSYVKRINIEFSSICNMQCSYCTLSLDRGRERYLDIALFDKLLSEVAQSPIRLQQLALYNSGESLLHPQFLDFLDVVTTYKARYPNFSPNVYMHTNGILWTPDQCDAILSKGVLNQVTWSLDGRDEESLERMRPGAKGKLILDNFEYLLDTRDSSLEIGVNNLVDKECIELPLNERMTHLFERADWVTSRYPNDLTGETLFGYYERNDENVGFCWYVFDTVVLSASGQITMCCVDLNEETAYGDFNTRSLRDIYFGKARRIRMLQMYRKQRAAIRGCAKCRMSEDRSNAVGDAIEPLIQ